MSVFTNPSSGAAEQATAYVEAVIGLLGERDPFEVLRDTPATLRSAVESLTPAQVATAEAPGKWSIREVVQHLADSELVWGWRLRLVLAEERPALTGFDQDAWAGRLRYRDADVAGAMALFEVLRRSNLVLSERASPEDLQRVGVHAERGAQTLDHMIRLWAGHDLLHLRQVARIGEAVAGATRPR